MSILFQIVLANVFVSLFSLVGIVFVSASERKLVKLTNWLISFASGALIGVAFLHMIPSSFKSNPGAVYITVFGIIIFFLLEKFFYWRHCHERGCEIHSFGYLNLIGDSLHNFIDGMVIAGSFVADVKFGLVTTLAIVAHEIPQELGDFGVLVHAGFGVRRALVLNFLTALFAVAGGVLGYIFTEKIVFIKNNLIPFAAGGFIYVALADLVPELHRKFSPSESLLQIFLILSGIIVFFML